MTTIPSIAPLRWGIVGYGNLADKGAAAALQHAACSSLVVVWGRDGDKTRDFATRHGIPRACATFNELLDSGIDALYICTPPDSHEEYTLAALAAGKHVLVEKPMAATVAECEAMTAAARAAGLTLGVAYYRRAYPKMQAVKALIDSGMLGVPTWVNIVAHSWYAPEAGQSWRVEKQKSAGGGAVADIGVHRLDLLDYWLGPTMHRYSDLQHLVQSYEVDDGASAILHLENGAPVHAYFSWNTRTFLDRFEIVGSEGKLILYPLDGPPLTVIRGSEVESREIAPPANAHLPCVEDFVAAVREGREPLCNGEAGTRTNRLLAAIVGR